jgi:hypothetical protein
MSATSEPFDPKMRGRPADLMSSYEHAWVLLLNPGTDKEGVYTLGRSSPWQEDEHHMLLLAFERREDAERCAILLQGPAAENFKPGVWPSDNVVNFCEARGFGLQYVPKGALMVPPPNFTINTEEDIKQSQNAHHLEKCFGKDSSKLAIVANNPTDAGSKKIEDEMLNRQRLLKNDLLLRLERKLEFPATGYPAEEA